MLSKSEELLISLIEHAVFSTEYDDVLRTQVKNRRGNGFGRVQDGGGRVVTGRGGNLGVSGQQKGKL